MADENVKKWFTSKTMWVNFAIGLVGLIGATLEQSPMDPQTVGMGMAGVGAVNMVLRSITNSGIGK